MCKRCFSNSTLCGESACFNQQNHRIFKGMAIFYNTSLHWEIIILTEKIDKNCTDYIFHTNPIQVTTPPKLAPQKVFFPMQNLFKKKFPHIFGEGGDIMPLTSYFSHF